MKVNEKQCFFERFETNAIKGIAILLMFFHHFFTIPSRQIESIACLYNNFHFELWQDSTKICVPIFAFLTGYLYFLADKKTYNYSLKKTTDLWICYLAVFILIVVIAMSLGLYNFSLFHFALELLSLSRTTMIHGWYVVFYVGVLLLLPIYHKVSQKSDFLAFSIFVILPFSFLLFLNFFPADDKFIFVRNTIEYFYYLPVVSSGYIFAKYRVFETLYCQIGKLNFGVKLLLSVFFMIIPFAIRSLDSSFDFIFAPMSIFGMVLLFRNTKYKKLYYPLAIIGKYSVYLWFLHCAFNNQLGSLLQPILYFPRNPLLVTIWGIIMCLLVAFIIKNPIDFLTKKKNELIFRKGEI